MQNYDVRTTPSFESSIRKLSHKYRSIRQDMEEGINTIEKFPASAVAIPGYAHCLWKKRVRNRDARTGKRSGYRIIYFWQPNTEEVYLLVAYSKIKKKDLTKQELNNLLSQLEDHLQSFDKKGKAKEEG
mgnify:CR=1 FL=1